MLLLAIVGCVVLVLLFLFFAPTHLGVDYAYENKKQGLRLRLRILGIPFSIKVPLDKKKSKTKEKKEKKDLTPKKFIGFSKSLYHSYLEVEDECKELVGQIKNRFACQKLSFVIRYGTLNPARTGIVNGAIWTAGSLVLKVLDEILGIKQKNLEVYPDFNRAFMCLNLNIMFQFTAFNAVRTVLKIIKLVNLIKSKLSLQENKD